MLQLIRKLLNWLNRFWQRFFGDQGEGSSRTPIISHPHEPSAATPPANILAIMAVDPPQYRARKSLCAYSERLFYEALRESVGSEYLSHDKSSNG